MPDYRRRQLRDDLGWLGLDWDAEIAAPEHTRCTAYAEALQLAALGLIYPCYCTRSELLDASAPHASDGTTRLRRNLPRSDAGQQRAVEDAQPRLARACAG